MKAKKQRHKKHDDKIPPDFLLQIIEERERNKLRVYVKKDCLVWSEEPKSDSFVFTWYILYQYQKGIAGIVITPFIWVIDTNSSPLNVVQVGSIVYDHMGEVEVIGPGVIGGKRKERLWEMIERIRDLEEVIKRIERMKEKGKDKKGIDLN